MSGSEAYTFTARLFINNSKEKERESMLDWMCYITILQTEIRGRRNAYLLCFTCTFGHAHKILHVHIHVGSCMYVLFFKKAKERRHDMKCMVEDIVASLHK